MSRAVCVQLNDTYALGLQQYFALRISNLYFLNCGRVILAIIEEDMEYTLDRLLVYCRANTESQTAIRVDIHSYSMATLVSTRMLYLKPLENSSYPSVTQNTLPLCLLIAISIEFEYCFGMNARGTVFLQVLKAFYIMNQASHMLTSTSQMALWSGFQSHLGSLQCSWRLTADSTDTMLLTFIALHEMPAVPFLHECDPFTAM